MAPLPRKIVLVALAFTWSSMAMADRLQLRDGSVLKGRFVGQSETEIHFEVAGELKSYQIDSVVALTLDRVSENNYLDLTGLDPSLYSTAIARAKSNHESREMCVLDCISKTTGDLNWDVACSDYCFCLWETDNPKTQCEQEFKGTTGSPPPFLQMPPTEKCSRCTAQFSRAKTCVDKDALGQNEDLIVKVPCDQSVPPSWNCRPCTRVVLFRRTCHAQGTSWDEPCTMISTPLIPLPR